MAVIEKVLELTKEVENRYASRSGARAAAEEQIAAGNMLDAQDARVRARLERLNIDPDTYDLLVEPAEDGAKGLVAVPAEDVNLLERILGFNDLISVHFLEQGWRAARAVGRIHISNGLGFGTGFMVSPRLMLTNNHVLPDSATAVRSSVEFDYQLGVDGRRLRTGEFDFAPDELFLTDAGLDFTLVAVKPVNERGQKLADYGWLPLIANENKVIVGEKLNIIQHPGGERKQLALRENQLQDILDDFLHYKTDTAPGSSGAPVFNDQWEVVALHHAGVPKTDDDDNFLTLGGKIWDDSMPATELAWKANEGVRISRIIQFIGDQVLSESGAALWAETRENPLAPADPVLPPVGVRTRTVGPQATTDPALIAVSGDLPGELTAPLAELSQFNERVYYDEKQDGQDRDAYYGSLAPAAGSSPAFDMTTADGWRIIVTMAYADADTDGAGAPTFDQLHNLLVETHTDQPKYKPLEHVYPWVDLHPDGKIRSIYSGKIYNPADFITEDLLIERQRAQQLQSFLARESAVSETAVAGFETLLEAQLPYNCEHVVPQSWFSHKEPMRGDLHHLFACESGCNSFRSNIPYFDFTDFGEATRSDCGKRLGNKFEPDAGKGIIARAVFYFLVRYPGLIEDQENEFKRERLPFLLAWHERHPVTAYERHRNETIFARQGNRNPFIDFPQWVGRIDLAKGLG